MSEVQDEKLLTRSTSRKKYNRPLDSMVFDFNHKIIEKELPDKPMPFRNHVGPKPKPIENEEEDPVIIAEEFELVRNDILLKEKSHRITKNKKGKWNKREKDLLKKKLFFNQGNPNGISAVPFHQVENNLPLVTFNQQWYNKRSDSSNEWKINSGPICRFSDDSTSSSSDDEYESIKQLKRVNTNKMMGNVMMPFVAMQPYPVQMNCFPYNPLAQMMIPQGTPFMQPGFNMGYNFQPPENHPQIDKEMMKFIKNRQAIKRRKEGRSRNWH